MTTIKITQKIKSKYSGAILMVYGINSRSKTYHVICVKEGKDTKVGEKFNVSFRSIEKQYTYVN